jgi:hypothetical protein
LFDLNIRDSVSDKRKNLKHSTEKQRIRMRETT